jgi:23S rRNA (guanine2445-N2)-methyltransferase / 23S rRNA (guanine2069-N7)-methyltransferase
LSGPALLSLVATVPRGLADLTVHELRELGATEVREQGAGVSFQGDLALAYRACLWSRTASRILLQLAQIEAPTADAFYKGVTAIDWRTHIDPARTIACEFTGKHAEITNTHFGVLRLKDGICDQLRGATGRRPDVSATRAAVRVQAHAHRGQITLFIDMAGEGLHRRGYRTEAGEAPLRENVAAGMLLRARWPDMARDGAAFLDPMCGSGTLVIEAAMIAAQRAPGLLRDYWGFNGWLGHNTVQWQEQCAAARARALTTVPNVLRGSDVSARTIRIAEANAERAGVADIVQLASQRVADVRPVAAKRGLIATNPPYGERLGDAASAYAAHEELGNALREHFAGWEAAIITAAPDGARALALRSYRTHELWNGAIACRLLRFDLANAGERDRGPRSAVPANPALAETPGALMFANRLKKNIKLLHKQARRDGVSCYRLYDADMPEYSFAIDQYVDADSAVTHLYVQEYAAPDSIDPAAARRRAQEALAALPGASGVAPEHIHLRVRQRQRGSGQYTQLATTAQYTTVQESGLKFLVNFTDYLDTGLFLDHRWTRARVRELSREARVLNLFCYTATACVYAAAGGATRTVSVDLSNTYLDWAAANFKLNALLKDRHELVRDDVREWLIAAATQSQRFEVIFLDPPTFSNSKRMEGVLDIQRDHADLIAASMRLLAPGGVLLFSTNARQFRLDDSIQSGCEVRDQSAASIPFDFKRNPRIHRCYELRARPG